MTASSAISENKFNDIKKALQEPWPLKLRLFIFCYGTTWQAFVMLFNQKMVY
jgi:hypothetical protein